MNWGVHYPCFPSPLFEVEKEEVPEAVKEKVAGHNTVIMHQQIYGKKNEECANVVVRKGSVV